MPRTKYTSKSLQDDKVLTSNTMQCVRRLLMQVTIAAAVGLAMGLSLTVFYVVEAVYTSDEMGQLGQQSKSILSGLQSTCTIFRKIPTNELMFQCQFVSRWLTKLSLSLAPIIAAFCLPHVFDSTSTGIIDEATAILVCFLGCDLKAMWVQKVDHLRTTGAIHHRF